MKIQQDTNGHHWVVTIDFENVAISKSKFPVYLAGDFNHWKKSDPQYQIPVPPNYGATNLQAVTITLPSDRHSFEFKAFAGGYADSNDDTLQWFETDDELYRGGHTFVSNRFGTKNVLVEKQI